MKWLRNLFIPKRASVIVMFKDGFRDESRIFLDEETMNRWIILMREDGYEIRGFIERIKILVNNKGN